MYRTVSRALEEAVNSADNENDRVGEKRHMVDFENIDEMGLDHHERLNRERLEYSARIEAAVSTYKSIFPSKTDASGSFTIPHKFVVPVGDSAWPENTWGLPLGLACNEIRNQGAYSEHHEKFQELGLDMNRQRAARVSVEKIETALETYRLIYPNKIDPITGIVYVPLKFVVPIGDVQWPEHTWGVKLGVLINDIRNRGHYADHHEVFREMGVDFSNQRDQSAAKVEMALETYRRIYPGKLDATGVLSIPCKFVVPFNDSAWPEETWGLKLGNSVNDIRNRGYHAEYHERYRELGLDMNRQKSARIPAGKIEAALEAYKRNFASKVEAAGGLITIPSHFVIPIGDTAWPEDTWGMKLGNAVSDIRNRGHHAHHHDRFQEIGLDMNRKRSVPVSGDLIEKALIAYQSRLPNKNGDIMSSSNSNNRFCGIFIVPPKFVVPTDDASWPKETWGLKLGSLVQRIRAGSDYPDYHERFRKIGLDIKGVTSADKVDVALSTYKMIHPELTSPSGAISIPRTFVIPSGEEAKTAGWPEELWGLKLGGIVFSIRYRGAYADCKERFRFLDLDYCSQEHSEKILKALLLYKMLHGGMYIPQKYKVIIGDPEWPEELWGLELGKDVRDIVKHGHHVAYHDKMRELGLEIPVFDEASLVAKAKMKATSRKLSAIVQNQQSEASMTSTTSSAADRMDSLIENGNNNNISFDGVDEMGVDLIKPECNINISYNTNDVLRGLNIDGDDDDDDDDVDSEYDA